DPVGQGDRMTTIRGSGSRGSLARESGRARDPRVGPKAVEAHTLGSTHEQLVRRIARRRASPPSRSFVIARRVMTGRGPAVLAIKRTRLRLGSSWDPSPIRSVDAG